MSPIWRIGLFLAAYLLFVLLSGQIFQTAVRDWLQRGKTRFILRGIGLALPLVPVIFVWILTGVFSTPILAVIVLATVLSALLSGLVRAITTVPGIDTSSGFLWLGGDPSNQLQQVSTFIFRIAIFIVFLFPIAAIAAYIHYQNSPLLIPVVTQILFVASGLQVAFGMLSGMVGLLSENIDENARTDSFIGEIAKVPLLTATLAIGAWSAVPGTPLALVGAFFSQVGPVPAAAGLALAAVLIGSIPYALGRIRSRRWRENLLTARKIWLTEIIGQLELSSHMDVFNVLRTTRDAVRSLVQPVIALDPRFSRMLVIDGGEQPKDDAERFAYAVYSRVRLTDPRLQHIAFMSYLGALSHSIASTIEETAPETRRAASAEYADSLRRWSQDLDRLASSEKRASNGVLAVVGALIGGATAAFVAEAGRWAWAAVAAGK